MRNCGGHHTLKAFSTSEKGYFRINSKFIGRAIMVAKCREVTDETANY